MRSARWLSNRERPTIWPCAATPGGTRETVTRPLPTVPKRCAWTAHRRSAYRTRGWARQAQREFGKALADFEAARRLEPQSDLCLAAMAWILATAPDANLRNGKRAVELAKEALAIAPKSAACMDALAAAYAEQGDFAAAVRWQEQATEDEPIAGKMDARRRLELYKQNQPCRP